MSEVIEQDHIYLNEIATLVTPIIRRVLTLQQHGRLQEDEMVAAMLASFNEAGVVLIKSDEFTVMAKAMVEVEALKRQVSMPAGAQQSGVSVRKRPG